MLMMEILHLIPFMWRKTWIIEKPSVIAGISKENQKETMFSECVLKG